MYALDTLTKTGSIATSSETSEAGSSLEDMSLRLSVLPYLVTLMFN